MKEKRLSNIDLIKFIAILFVILYHCHLHSFDIIYSKTFYDYLLYFLNTILSTCVPLFFFVNGYLLLNKKFDLKKHIKKIIKLFFLIIIWSVIMIIFNNIVYGGADINKAIFSILNLENYSGLNIFWYLLTLISIYLVFPLLKTTYDNNEKNFIFFVIVCIFFTFGIKLIGELFDFLSYIFHNSKISIDYPLFNLLNPFKKYGYSFAYFCVGGLIYKYKEKILLVSKSIRNCISIFGILFNCTCLFLVGLFYSKYVNNSIFDVVWDGYNTVFTFLNVIFIYVLSLNYTKNNTFIKYISTNTLGVYFIHGIIIKITRPILLNYDYLHNFCSTLIYAFGVLLISICFCYIIKKIPLVKRII